MNELTYDIATVAEILADDYTVATAPSTKNMSRDERGRSIAQMLIDLKKLAENDGCIAAGWAYEYFMQKTLGRCDLATT